MAISLTDVRNEVESLKRKREKAGRGGKGAEIEKQGNLGERGHPKGKSNLGRGAV